MDLVEFFKSTKYVDIPYILMVTLAMHIIYSFLIPKRVWYKLSKPTVTRIKIIALWTVATGFTLLMYSTLPFEPEDRKLWVARYFISTSLCTVFYDLILKSVFRYFENKLKNDA